MPVTYAVNRNIVGNPVLASNIASLTGSNITFAIPDNQGNVYVGGTFQAFTTTSVYLPNATVTGPGTTNSSNTLTNAAIFTPAAAGSNSGFIAKYYSTGGLAWSLPFGNVAAVSNVTVNSCAIDPTNYANIYVALTYTATAASILINGAQTAAAQTASSVTLPSVSASVSNQTAGALVKINAAGSIQWASVIESTANNETGISVTVDSTGSPYLVTTYGALATINILNGVLNAPPSGTTVTLPLTGTGSTAFALVKYNTSGIALWSTALDVSSGVEVAVAAPAIAIDQQSNIYVGGSYSSSTTAINVPIIATTSGGSGAAFTLPIATNTVGFLAKYTSGGSALWASILGNGATSLSASYINYITTSGYNTVYVCGNIISTATTAIYNGVLNTTPASSNQSSFTLPIASTATAFIAKYSLTGASQYISYLQGTGACNFNSCAVDSSDVNLYVSGRYISTSAANIVNYNGSVTTTVPLNTASASGVLIRYFLGNAIAATTDAFTGTSSTNPTTGYTIVAIDPNTSNVYAGGNYYNTTGTTPLYNANAIGGSTGTVILPQMGALTSNCNGFWVRFG